MSVCQLVFITTFVLRFFLHMKKLLLTSVLLATVFIVIGGMNALNKIQGIYEASNDKINNQTTSFQSAKYEDCITKDDLPDGFLLYTHELTNPHANWDIEKVNESVQKYGKSLDSTIKNLSTVDAHEFIHHTFNKAKSALATDSISDIKKHYHAEMMKLCYTRDKLLSQNTVGVL